jgi:hypothetical protein
MICLGLALQIAQPNGGPVASLIPAIGGGLVGLLCGSRQRTSRQTLPGAGFTRRMCVGSTERPKQKGKGRREAMTKSPSTSRELRFPPTSAGPQYTQRRRSIENSQIQPSATVTILRRKGFRSYGG